MKRTNLIQYLILFYSVLFLFTGCEVPQSISYLSIYNVNDADKIEVFLHDLSFNSGLLKGKLDDGTKVSGNYYFNFSEPTHTPPGMVTPTIVEFLTRSHPDTSITEEQIALQLESTFPDLYGYSRETAAYPVGSAMLVSKKKGLSIEMVFYSLQIQNRTGDGVGIDNDGNLYRVYLNTETN